MIILQKNDYVKLLDSPYSPIKMGARGLVVETFLNDDWQDYHLAIIRFKLNGEYINLETGSNRFIVVGHKREHEEENLPDSENILVDELEETI